LLYNLKNILRKLWFISEIIFADVEEMVKWNVILKYALQNLCWRKW
jgi:hypothetical protein